MDNLIPEIKEQLRVCKEESDKLKRHQSRLDELYGDLEDIVIKLEKRLLELHETAPKSKLRKIEEENQNLKDQLAELQAREKEFSKDIRRDVKESNYDALDILNGI